MNRLTQDTQRDGTPTRVGILRRLTCGVLDFFEDRLKLVSLYKFLASKPVPKGLNFSYTLGSVSLFLLANQLFTGMLLAIYYKPTVAAAYDSVRFIEETVRFGWLIRQLHAWGANLMILAVCMHMIRIFWYGSYKRPRELNWLLGVGLLGVTMTFGFTGYLLPWDQVAYWASKVGTEIPGALPWIGPYLIILMRGGPEITEATLGRFYMIHTMVLPGLIVFMVLIHLAIMRLHGITSPGDEEVKETVPFFPNHVLKDAISIYAVLALLYALVVLSPWRLHGQADPLVTPEGVKPEWYFLWMYQFIKYFPQQIGPLSGKVVGIVTSSSFFVLLALLPFIDRSPFRSPRRRKLVVAIGILLLLGIVFLTFLGFICERELTIFGTHYHFDILGFPRAVKGP